MSVTYNYKNSHSGRSIEEGNVVSVSKAGVVETYGEKGMRFTPSDEVNMNVYKADNGYPEEEPPALPERPDLTSFTAGKGGNSESVVTSYYFGLDNIACANNISESVCGYVSPEIHIGTSDYITLYVDMNFQGSEEFSIVDVDGEHPIFPINLQEVKNEKLFWNLPLRFTVDKHDPMLIRKNGIATTMKLSEITQDEYGRNNFSVDYTPAFQSHIYHPKGKDIKVKIIQRCENGQLPAVITSMSIQKFGGDKIWNTLG